MPCPNSRRRLHSSRAKLSARRRANRASHLNLGCERLEDRALLSGTPISHLVNGLYQDVLNRAPDAEGFHYWTSSLAAGTTQQQLAAAFMGSPEHHGKVVQIAYDTYLRRAVDDEGLDYWVGELQHGARQDQVLAAILGSEEYYELMGGSDDGYIFNLFQDLCEREPEGDEWDGARGVLAHSREELTQVLLSADECRGVQLERLYQLTVGRGIDDGGREYWLEGLRNGVDYGDVRLALCASDEYSDRALASGDAVIDWNLTAFDTLREDRKLKGPTWASRSLAMMHAAIYDAVNAIDGSHLPYMVYLVPADGASDEAAVAGAAHRVLSNLYPDQQYRFDAQLAESLANVPDGPGEDSGLELGRLAADAILAQREFDGAYDPAFYEPTYEPGTWQPDPLNPGQQALTPGWGNVVPFGMADGRQFVPPPPPAMDSPEYTAAFDEVYRLGGADSSERTEDQTEIGIYWGYDRPGLGTPPVLYNQIAQTLALGHGNTLAENARLFALVNFAQADAGITSWAGKYDYNVWRPVTAIQQADTDGNLDTQADPEWIPLGAPGGGEIPDFTPPFPAYTSGHATFGAAAFRSIANFYGTDNLPFVQQSDELLGIYRSFDSLTQASEENGQSRIYLGIHWQFDNQVGQQTGNQVADYIFSNTLVPLA